MKIEKFLREDQINSICQETENEIFELISMELASNEIYIEPDSELINDILKKMIRRIIIS
jgi:hypothetical protein